MSERSEITDTPHKYGTASNASYESLHGQEHYKPYLQADTHDALTIPFHDILCMAFGLEEIDDFHPTLETISKSSRFGKLLAHYLSPTRREEDLYARFNELANYVLRALKRKDILPTSAPIVVCRNDPRLIKGSRAHRKPDCVIVHQSAIDEVPGRKEAHKTNQSPPIDSPFCWPELLTFVEFKAKSPSTTAGSRSSSGTPAVSRPPSCSQSARPTRSTAKSNRQSAESKSSRTPAVKSLPQPSLVDVPGPSPRAHRRSTHSHRKPAQASASLHASSSQQVSIVLNHPKGSTSASSSTFLDAFSTTSTSNVKYSIGTSRSKRSGDDDLIERPSKRSRQQPDPVLQCASYALEMMSYGGFRTHAFGILISGRHLKFMCFDRSRTVISEPLNFEKDKLRFVALLYYLGKATSTQLGLVSAIVPGPNQTGDKKDKSLVGMRITLNDGTVLEIMDDIFMQHALVGRGTCVVRAKTVNSNKWEGKKIVVKLSFTPKSRKPEGQILNDIVKIANSSKKNKWVLDHIPEVLHYEVIKPDANGLHARLSEYFRKADKPFEERVLTVLVMTEQCPIEELNGPKDLMKAFIDIFKCHRWLYKTAKILHRDVSLNNMMFRQKGGKVYGVLSDYDLVLELKNMGLDHSSQHRTGTLPFMAIDLLEIPPVLHYYRHDLESMFYVLSLIVTGNDRSPFQEWYTLDQGAQKRAKNEYIVNDKSTLVREYGCLHGIVSGLRVLFANALLKKTHVASARRHAALLGKRLPPALEEETLGGLVDFNKFEEIITHSF